MANPEHLAILKQGVDAWNKWRWENPLVRPDLAGIDLLGANLAGIIFLDANLLCTNLEEASLLGADMEGASLKGTNLKRTDLKKADFYGANLGSANLQDTNVKDAKFGYTNLSDVDLSQMKGLEEVRHLGPSQVDTRTLERSAASIAGKASDRSPVETFLRGAGLDEQAISYFRSLIGKPVEFYSCFISYCHTDRAFARRLHDGLQARGIRCWLDEHQVLPGDHILDQVDRGIRLWDKVLLCCSKESLTSVWVDREIEKAMRKEERLWKERGERVLAIIPLNLDGYLFGWESSKADLLQTRLAADFAGWEKSNAKFEEQFEKVVKALRADEAAREEPPETKL